MFRGNLVETDGQTGLAADILILLSAVGKEVGAILLNPRCNKRSVDKMYKGLLERAKPWVVWA